MTCDAFVHDQNLKPEAWCAPWETPSWGHLPSSPRLCLMMSAGATASPWPPTPSKYWDGSRSSRPSPTPDCANMWTSPEGSTVRTEVNLQYQTLASHNRGVAVTFYLLSVLLSLSVLQFSVVYINLSVYEGLTTYHCLWMHVMLLGQLKPWLLNTCTTLNNIKYFVNTST